MLVLCLSPRLCSRPAASSRPSCLAQVPAFPLSQSRSDSTFAAHDEGRIHSRPDRHSFPSIPSLPHQASIALPLLAAAVYPAVQRPLQFATRHGLWYVPGASKQLSDRIGCVWPTSAARDNLLLSDQKSSALLQTRSCRVHPPTNSSALCVNRMGMSSRARSPAPPADCFRFDHVECVDCPRRSTGTVPVHPRYKRPPPSSNDKAASAGDREGFQQQNRANPQRQHSLGAARSSRARLSEAGLHEGQREGHCILEFHSH